MSNSALATDEDGTVCVMKHVVTDAAQDGTAHLALTSRADHYHYGARLARHLNQQLPRLVAEHGLDAAGDLSANNSNVYLDVQGSHMLT